MTTFNDKLTAIGPEGQKINIEAQVENSSGPEGQLVKTVKSVTIAVNVDVDVDDDLYFTHPSDGKRYKVNPDRL